MTEWRAWSTSAGWLRMPDADAPVATGDWVRIGLRPCPEGCLRLWWTGGRVAVIESVSRCPATIVYRGTMQPAEGSGEEEGNGSHLLVRVRGGRRHGCAAPPPAHSCPGAADTGRT